MSDLTYGVIGTGAIGGFYGGILANSGKEVNFLLHSDYNHVKKQGLTIKSKVFGEINCKRNFFKSVSEMPACDVILVGLKTTQNYCLKELLLPVIKNNSVVVLIQNGLGMEEDLQKEFPDLSIIGGVAQILSFKNSPGEIVHQQLGNLVLGVHGEKEIPVINQIISDFNHTNKIKCMKENLNLIRWMKLVWNIPFNGLSVVLNTQTDSLVTDENAESLVEDLMKEIVEGASKSGAKLPPQIVSEQITITKKMPPYSPSMKLDFNNNRQMEIKYMYEIPVEIAKQSGYYMSKVDMLAKQLHFLEDRINI